MSIADQMSGMVRGGAPKRGGITERMGKPAEAEHEGEKGVPEHLQEMHAKMGGKHMHIHSDGMEHTTHHVTEDGKVEGPHTHESTEALKQHVGKFLDEEDHEGGGYGGSHHSSGGPESMFD